MSCGVIRLMGVAWISMPGMAVVVCFGLLPQWLSAQTLNHPPELMSLTNWVVGERRIVTFTNVASDVDVPPQTLTFSIGPRIPDGAVIDPATGVFYWRPSEIQGVTTNIFEIIVSDDGVPSLSATQQFQIIVRDTLPDFALSLGSTNLLLNEAGSVSVLFSTRVPVTNVLFTLHIASDRLTDVRFTSRIASDAVVQFNATGLNRYSGSIGTPYGSSLQGTLELGALGFVVVDQPDSAIVPLEITQLSGIRSDGRQIGQTAANPGRVIIVINEPVLEIDPSSPGRIRVHRLPGKTATLQFADATLNPWRWSRLADFVARPFKTMDLIEDPNWRTGTVFRATIPRVP